MAACGNITRTTLTAAGYRLLYAGDDYDYSVTVELGGAALSLVGATVWFTAKRKLTDRDSEAVLAFDSTDATRLQLTDPAAGELVLHFLAADTVHIPGVWEYDLKAKLSAGNRLHLCRGKIEFLDSVTRQY